MHYFKVDTEKFGRQPQDSFVGKIQNLAWCGLHGEETSPRPASAKSKIQNRNDCQQTSLWRNWTVCHTSLINHRSEVPIVLVHGFGSSMGHWRRNMFELARYHSVYALDLLGFGASEKADTSYSIELWVEQIYDFWQTHVKVPAVLVGNSIGSIVCLAAAATHPELAKGVATIGLPNLSTPPSSCWPLRVMTHQLKQLLTSRTSRLVLQPLFHLLRQPWVIRGWLQLAYVRSDEITDELLEILTAPTRDRGAA